MTEPMNEAAWRTEEQVRSLVGQLAAEHSLPADPPKGSLWFRLGQAIAQAYVDRADREGVRGGRAIIMAGPPGAGKSKGVAAVRTALGPKEAERLGVVDDGFITVDADDVKQVLLGNPVAGLDVDPELVGQAREHWDRLIADHAPRPLADGRPLLRGELSTLVHQLSTDTANDAREQLMAEHVNITIEGTLQWMEPSGKGQGPRLINALRTEQYTQVTIVAVDTPQQMCLEAAHQRWITPRSQGDVTARYTPPAAVTSMFTPNNTVSRCIDNARITHQLASVHAPFSQVNLFIAHRSPTSTVIEHVDRDGLSRSTTLQASTPPTKPLPPRTPTRNHPLQHNRITPPTPGLGR